MPAVVQLSIFDYIDAASKTPVDADLFELLDRVSESIEFLPTSEKLAVAGEAILRLGEIYGDRSWGGDRAVGESDSSGDG